MLKQATVFFVSSSYPNSEKDWKSVFIAQLLKGLSEIDYLQLEYWGPPGRCPDNVDYACHTDDGAWLSQLMLEGGMIHLFRQNKLKSIGTLLKFLSMLRQEVKRNRRVDIYHINWLQNAIPLSGIREPAVISVLGSDMGLLRIPGMTSCLRWVFKQRPTILAPNAEWMQKPLEKAFAGVAEVVFVPLGIDRGWYDVKRWAWERGKKKWLVVSRLTEKKLGPLVAWGEPIFKEKTHHQLHLFGPMQEKIALPQWIHYHGPTSPDALMETWFPQAAGLITLSRHDEGRPQVMLEAMAAGVPIIASRIQAHLNFLRDRETGWLTDDKKDFKTAVQWMEIPENNALIAKNARNWVMSNVGTWKTCAKRYSDLYARLLSRKSRLKRNRP